MNNIDALCQVCGTPIRVKSGGGTALSSVCECQGWGGQMNTTHPCLPDYTGPTSGLFGLVHHDILYEYSDNIMGRVEFYNSRGKPDRELPVRRRCLVYLDPTGRSWAAAYEQWLKDRALSLYNDAQWDEDFRQWKTEREGVEEGVEEQWQAAKERWKAANQQWCAAQEQWRQWEPQILAQIQELVPDLPWDGIQLVF